MPRLDGIQRLLSMAPGEIASRLRQGLARRIDSLGLFQPRMKSPPLEASGQSGKFFFSVDEIPKRIQLIRRNVPDFEKNVLGQSEQILNHRFPLLGYGNVEYGSEIDWQLDAVSGKRAPDKPWPKIDYLSFDDVGDTKVTWELSRHQFFATLAKAWLLTGEERFVAKLAGLFYDWHTKNPYPLGINWASSLEVAFRSLSWIWVRELLAGCESAAQLRRDIVRALAFNAWYIRRYLSTYFSPNTHLQGEAVALFFIGTLYPAMRGASDWRRAGWRILLEHAQSKVLEDGAYFEQSTYYHVYALDFFLHARVLAERNGTVIPASYDSVLIRMLKYLSYLCQAGPPPRFGDDDGGRVFDPRRNQAEYLCDPLATGTAIYHLPELKLTGVGVTEEMLWLLGEDGLQAFSDCPEWGDTTSAMLSESGTYVSHAGNASRSQALFDAGPLGGGSGGHGHADALNLTLNIDGKQLLVDPGACSYVGPGSDREYFRTTTAHNTVMIDRLSQAEVRTPFSWFRWPEVTVEAAAFTSEIDFISASHDGYSRLRPPVVHRRTLAAPHAGFWFVLDELVGDGPHDYEFRWHLAPGTNIRQENEDRWVVEREGGELHILTVAIGWQPSIASGWFSPAYGARQSSEILSLSKKAAGNEVISTVLWSGAPGTRPPILRPLGHVSGVNAYDLSHGDTRWIFIFGRGESSARIDGWESDARFIHGKLAADGLPSRVILVQGTHLRFRGETFFESALRRGYFVWERNAFGQSRPT